MTRRHPHPRRSFVAWTALIGLAACGLPPQSSGLRLAVAASLKNVMAALDQAYRTQPTTPAAQIQSAGSGALAQQIIDGAAFDLFVAADRPAMDKVVAAGIVATDSVRVVAQTTVVVVAHPSSTIRRIADLGEPGKRVVLADSTVPAGRYAERILAQQDTDTAMRIRANVVSYEANVSAVLQKIVSGEAEAGIVYQADVSQLSTANIRVILPDQAVYAEYVAAILPRAQAGSQAFLTYLTSPAATATWQQYGFTPLS